MVIAYSYSPVVHTSTIVGLKPPESPATPNIPMPATITKMTTWMYNARPIIVSFTS